MKDTQNQDPTPGHRKPSTDGAMPHAAFEEEAAAKHDPTTDAAVVEDGGISQGLMPDTRPESQAHPDITSLRLSQDFALTGGVKKALLTVPVRKPNRQEWVRVHPSQDMHFPAAVITRKDENETYIVEAGLRDELEGEWAPMMLYPAINRQGVVFLWPVRLPGEDGRLDPWNQSATEAVSLAMTGWVRVASNRSLGAYEVFQPTSTFPEPIWPEKTIDELVTIAFRNRVIDSADHPILRLLRGEV